MNTSSVLLTGFVVTLALGTPLPAAELPPELPLWEKGSPEHAIPHVGEEQVRSVPAPPGSPSGLNRAFSSVSSPTYSIHRPRSPNGVGLVICPGGGFRDVWLDREGHDLAIRLMDYNVTSLVLKYRTRPADLSAKDAWRNYQRAVRSDGRQAIRILRRQAGDLGLEPNKIGICGFSAGGYLAINCALHGEPELPAGQVGGMPDFSGLFYPGIPDDAHQLVESRTSSEGGQTGICPMFIVNARDDKLTPVDRCVDFYSALLKAEVNAELHVFSKGAHGFGLGDGRGESTAMWPASFAGWLRDINMIQP